VGPSSGAAFLLAAFGREEVLAMGLLGLLGLGRKCWESSLEEPAWLTKMALAAVSWKEVLRLLGLGVKGREVGFLGIFGAEKSVSTVTSVLLSLQLTRVSRAWDVCLLKVTGLREERRAPASAMATRRRAWSWSM
jgi:hypothetical protein